VLTRPHAPVPGGTAVREMGLLPPADGPGPGPGRDYGPLRDFLDLMPTGETEEDLIAGAIVLFILTGQDVDIAELARKRRERRSQ
jgi:hypothetical protein